ncbi:MAG: response regulator [Ekhidna sp.]|nr:response regulator [Ekhidna sp.]
MQKTPRQQTLLLIDDSPMIRNFLQAFFSEEYTVLAYSSTSKALEDLSEGTVSPDCILTDFYLGKDLNGLEFVQTLKEIDPAIPVMILSGSCDMKQKVECLENGAADFVNKPFSPLELDARVRNILPVSANQIPYRNVI